MRAVFLNSGGGGNVRPSASRASIVASGIAPPWSLAVRRQAICDTGHTTPAETPTEGCRRLPSACACKRTSTQTDRLRRNLHGRARRVVRGRGPRLRHPFEVLHRALSL